MEFITLTKIKDNEPAVINSQSIEIITQASYIGTDGSQPCTRLTFNTSGFIDVMESFDTVLTMLGCTNEEHIDKLAKKIQRQDEVAFPTTASAKKAIKEDPVGIIDWLLECLRQAQR